MYSEYIRFNTSHVVVYQSSQISESQVHLSFNTSHVVVYQYLQSKAKLEWLVSIHLML